MCFQSETSVYIQISPRSLEGRYILFDFRRAEILFRPKMKRGGIMLPHNHLVVTLTLKINQQANNQLVFWWNVSFKTDIPPTKAIFLQSFQVVQF